MQNWKSNKTKQIAESERREEFLSESAGIVAAIL
jgi:hypothetical protein